MRPDTTPCSSRDRCDGVTRAVTTSRTALALDAHGLPVGPMVAPAFALLALATAVFRGRR